MSNSDFAEANLLHDREADDHRMAAKGPSFLVAVVIVAVEAAILRLVVATTTTTKRMIAAVKVGGFDWKPVLRRR